MTAYKLNLNLHGFHFLIAFILYCNPLLCATEMNFSTSATTRSCWRAASWDNAPIESWFNSFKNERVHGRRYATRAEMRAARFEYIEVFYNRTRWHSTLGYRSPMQFLDDCRMVQHEENLVARHPPDGRRKTEGSS